MQGTLWSQPSIASLFHPIVWQGPESWGAPFAELLAEFLEAKCKASNVACAQGRQERSVTTPSDTMISPEGSESQDLGEQCLEDRTVDLCCSVDCSADTEVNFYEGAPKITAAQLKAHTSDNSTPFATVSTACLEAQKDDKWCTAFEAANPPRIGLFAYLQRIGRYSGCSTVCLVHACEYMLRLESCGAEITPLTVHRLLATAVVLAAKYMDDTVWTNAHYARVTGISLAEFNHMERLMFCLLDFTLTLSGPMDVLNKVRSPLMKPQDIMKLHQQSVSLDSHCTKFLIKTH